jgi:hypothetical protein
MLTRIGRLPGLRLGRQLKLHVNHRAVWKVRRVAGPMCITIKWLLLGSTARRRAMYRVNVPSDYVSNIRKELYTGKRVCD